MSRLRMETGHPVSNNVQPVAGDCIRFVTDDNRCMFEVSVGKDSRSLEIRAVEMCRVDGVMYAESILITPNCANSITVETRKYGK